MYANKEDKQGISYAWTLASCGYVGQVCSTSRAITCLPNDNLTSPSHSPDRHDFGCYIRMHIYNDTKVLLL